MPSEVVPGDSMDPTHAATAIVASPAHDLAVATSIVAAEAFAVVASVVVVEVSEAVEAAEVVAVVAGKCGESEYEKSQEHGYEIDTRKHKILATGFHSVCGGVRIRLRNGPRFCSGIDGENGSAKSSYVIYGCQTLRYPATGCRCAGHCGQRVRRRRADGNLRSGRRRRRVQW